MHASTKDKEGTYTALAFPSNDVYTTVGQTSQNIPGAQNKGTQEEDTTYSEIKTTDSSSPKTVSHCGPAGEKNGQSSHPYRLAAVCLGLLCALLLTAIIALSIHYTSLSQKYSTMERNLEHLRANYSNITEANSQLQKYHNEVLQKFPLVEKYCPLISQKGVCRPCPQGWELFNSKCYYFSTKQKNWQGSRSDCRTQGTDLVIIDSEVEQEFITNHAKGSEYWIGLSYSKTEQTWLWVNSTPLRKRLWRKGEPDNYYYQNQWYSYADCAFTFPGEKTWADKPCNFNGRYVCETEALLR